MAKRRGSPSRRPPRAPSRRRTKRAEPAAAITDDQLSYSNLSLHDLFQQQAMQMLDRSDLDEEQKQSILVAMSCPCCGAGGMSFTAKIKRRS